MRLLSAVFSSHALPSSDNGAGSNASNGAQDGRKPWPSARPSLEPRRWLSRSRSSPHATALRRRTREAWGCRPSATTRGNYGCLSTCPGLADRGAGARGRSSTTTSPRLRPRVRQRRPQAQAPSVRSVAKHSMRSPRAGSDHELAQDHKQNQHMTLHAPELHAVSAELQGSPDGANAQASAGSARGEPTLLRWMGEGPGGMHHDTLLRPRVAQGRRRHREDRRAPVLHEGRLLGVRDAGGMRPSLVVVTAPGCTRPRHRSGLALAGARARAHGAAALVVPLEGGLVLPQRAHDAGGEVVLAVGAAGIAARDQEERGRLIDHDAARYASFPRRRSDLRSRA